MRRERVLLIAMIPIAIIAVGSLWLDSLYRGTAPAHFSFEVRNEPQQHFLADSLQLGMDESQVQCILGGPPGDYRSRNVDYSYSGFVIRTPPGIRKDWFLDSEHISVWFEGGKVTSYASGPAVSSPNP